MIDMKLNKDRLGVHWHYYRFRYALVLVLVLVGANFLLSATKPQTPPELRVDVQIVSDAYSSDAMDLWQQQLLCLLPPDQKELNVSALPLIAGDSGTVYQMLAARMSAREGTIWILPASYFEDYAKQGAFLPLDDNLSSFSLPKDIDLSKVKVAEQNDDGSSGVPHVYGIPLDKCTGLSEYFIVKDMVLVFPSYAKVNFENAKIIANYMLSRTDTPPVPSAAETPAPSAIPKNNGFRALIAASSISSYDTADWQKEMQGVLKSSPVEAGISLIPYHAGREEMVSRLLVSRSKKEPIGFFAVPHDIFVSLARSGALMKLDDAASRFTLPVGTDISLGKESILKNDKTAGPVQLYGLPLDKCTGFSKVFNPAGMMLVFPAQPEENFSAAIDAANALLAKAVPAK